MKDDEGKGLPPGGTFGRYVIDSPIGAGGMATVYAARHVDLQRRVALKVLHPWLALRLDVVQRFVIEGRAASRFSHPHVVDIIDIGAVDRVPFMAMELLEGEPLSAILDQRGPLGLEHLVEVFIPILSAVEAVHEAGVLHRDLKPENIFIARRGLRGMREHPMLLDFGISKLVTGGRAQPLTAAGELLGTPPYMSPEQVQNGMSSFDARSDQYALGVVLYESATGKLPYPQTSSVNDLMLAIARGGAPLASARRPDLPAAFDAVLARAMALDPADRFPSVLDLARALLPFASPGARARWTEELSEADLAREAQRARAPAPALSPADLRAVPLFSDVPAEEIARLPALAPAVRFAPEAALFDQGVAAASAFVVVSGKVDLTRIHGVDTFPVGAVGPGGVLGLASLWDEGVRSVTAVAREETVAIEIPRAALGLLDAACPTLADRLHDTARDAAVRRRKRATERVAELLDRPFSIPSSAAPAGATPGGSAASGSSRERLVQLAAALGEWSVPMPRRPR